MAAFYGEEQVRRVREAADIVQLVSEYTPVRKSGANFACCCLFHQERSPSMYLYPHDNSYHCFGCGAHGDVIRLVMEKERLPFVEALEALARRAAIRLEPQAGTGGHAQDRGERERHLKAMEFACRFYEERLWSPEGAEALAYLRGRGLSDDCLKAFRIGWAPGGSALVEEARRRRADPRVLVPLDLAVERDGRLRDRFYERVTFPICDRLGLPIAFSARLLPEAERRAKEEGRGVGKYINSTDTPLYHKGKAVFNLHQARQAVKDAGLLAVMEGPTDVMAAWQAGLKACVAVLGTALTPEHAKVLGQTTAGARLVLLFDGDRAGQTNSLKAVRTCLAAGVSCSVAALPDELDPSELLTEEAGAGGIARLREVLDRARDGLGHLLRGTVPSPYSMPRDQLAAAARGLADAIRAIPDPQARTLAVREAEQWLGFPLALRSDAPATDGPPAPAAARPLDPKRDLVLHILLRHPELRTAAGDGHQMEPADWPEPWTEVAGLLLCDPGAGGDALRALPAAQDQEVAKRIGWWLATGLDARTPPVEDPAAALADAAPRLLRDRLKTRRAELQRALADAEREQDPARITVLAEELAALSNRLADLGG